MHQSRASNWTLRIWLKIIRFTMLNCCTGIYCLGIRSQKHEPNWPRASESFHTVGNSTTWQKIDAIQQIIGGRRAKAVILVQLLPELAQKIINTSFLNFGFLRKCNIGNYTFFWENKPTEPFLCWNNDNFYKNISLIIRALNLNCGHAHRILVISRYYCKDRSRIARHVLILADFIIRENKFRCWWAEYFNEI